MTNKYVILKTGEMRSADELAKVDSSEAPAQLILISEKKFEHGSTSVELFEFNLGDYVVVKNKESGKVLASAWNMNK